MHCYDHIGSINTPLKPTGNKTDTRKYNRELKEELDLLIGSGRWLVWSGTVYGPFNHGPKWRWEYRTNHVKSLPLWFDVPRNDGEDLVALIGQARLPEDNEKCHQVADRAFRSKASGYGQVFRVRLRDGRISWIEENVTIKLLPDGSRRLMGICIDATERKLSEEQLQHLQYELIARNEELQALREKLECEKFALADANVRLEDLATIDGLTGVKNHRIFQEQLMREWHAATRYMTPLSLLMLDIDHFKAYNDAFGHPAGDVVLRQVGRLLAENARETDHVARYGGEEFVAILPQTDALGSTGIAERFRASIENWPWKQRQITISVGVATLSPLIANPQAFIELADRAMYRAKFEGRNRVCRETKNVLVRCVAP